MKKRHIILSCIIAALVMSASIGGAMSYFTTYAEARGGGSITLGDETNIDEKVVSGGKEVKITSTEGSKPVYVRVRAFADTEKYPITYDGSGWTESTSDGWCYYDLPLAGGATTDVLKVNIGNIPKADAAKKGDHFNVVVVYETIPAVEFNDDGTPVPAAQADWTKQTEVLNAEGGE